MAVTELDRALGELRHTVKELEIDVWKGRDLHNPSITARLSALEKCVKDIEEAAERQRTSNEKKVNLTLAAVLTSIAALLTEIVFRR